MKAETMRYVNTSDIQSLNLNISELADEIALVLKGVSEGTVWANPNSVISPVLGTRSVSFHAAGLREGISVHKTLGLSNGNTARKIAHMGGLINVHDIHTGHPLAVLDADEITGLRTAALSVLAARFLAAPTAHTISFVGAGQQALHHLSAFCAEYPIRLVKIFQPNGRDTQRLADACKLMQISTEFSDDWSHILSDTSIVVTTVPNSPSMEPFLSTSAVQNDTFIAAVDSGRSWLRGSFEALDQIVVDDLAAFSPTLATSSVLSLEAMIKTNRRYANGEKNAFVFAGTPLADLAAVKLVLDKASATDLGVSLSR